MRVCPLCQSIYPDNAYYCSVHGVRLADVRPFIDSTTTKPNELIHAPEQPVFDPSSLAAEAQEEEEPAVELAEETQEQELPTAKLVEEAQEEEPTVELAEETQEQELPAAELAEDDPLVGTTLRSYRLIKYLGTGATGPVYLAKHLHEHNRVAIKILHPELTQDPKAVAEAYRTLEELQELGHRNLITTIERVHELDSPSFYVMEALAGANLAATLASSQTFSLSYILNIAVQMTNTLTITHRAKKVHGHLSPRNIFLLNRGTPQSMLKVLDFDSAALLTQSHQEDTITAGLYRFRAPELETNPTITPHCDIYSVGFIIGEMLQSLTPEAKESVPEELSDLVDSCLSESPAVRPESMKKLASELESISREKLPLIQKTKQRTSNIVWSKEALIDPDMVEAQEELELYEWKMRAKKSRRRNLGIVASLGLALGMGYQAMSLMPLHTTTTETSVAQSQPELDPKEDKTTAPAKEPALKAVPTPKAKAATTETAKPPVPAKPKPTEAPKTAKAASPRPTPTATKSANKRRPVVEQATDKEKLVRLEFTSSPRGAQVVRTRDAKIIGTTPVVLELPEGDRTETYQFSLSGYKASQQKVKPTSSMRVIATMNLIETPKPKATRAESTTEKKTPEQPSSIDRHALVDPFADEQG